MFDVVEMALRHDGILRIDAALEGDWSPTVTPVWSPEDGFLGFDLDPRSHPVYKPSLELYFVSFWLGVHCYNRRDGLNVFDEAAAERLIRRVEAAIGGPRAPR